MPERILVVEDDRTLRETLAYNLTQQGYRVVTTKDGQRALSQVGSSRDCASPALSQ